MLHNRVYASGASTVHFSMILQEALGAKSKPTFDLYTICPLCYLLNSKQENRWVRAFDLKVLITSFSDKLGRRKKQSLHWQGQFGDLHKIRQEVSGSKERTLLLYSVYYTLDETVLWVLQKLKNTHQEELNKHSQSITELTYPKSR